ncbi:hypothetical protein L596_012364 [Steinernema carpocapsae]|uniref:Uncharacterized protein n=1 Tax=Steinernema carpocapsae TaxID=34508 RepID=A0A4U5NWT9_STECR|nr:hypothetical protein L596_012364 [Steinernema carpocapsae]
MGSGGKKDKRKKDRKKADEGVVLVEDKIAVPKDEGAPPEEKKKEKKKKKSSGGGLAGLFGLSKEKDEKPKKKHHDKKKHKKHSDDKKHHKKPKEQVEGAPAMKPTKHRPPSPDPKPLPQPKKVQKPEPLPSAPTSSGRPLSIDNNPLVPKKAPRKVKKHSVAKQDSSSMKPKLANSVKRAASNESLPSSSGKSDSSTIPKPKKKPSSAEPLEKKASSLQHHDKKERKKNSEGKKHHKKPKKQAEGASEMKPAKHKPPFPDLEHAPQPKKKASKQQPDPWNSSRTNFISDRFPLGGTLVLSSPENRKLAEYVKPTASGESDSSGKSDSSTAHGKKRVMFLQADKTPPGSNEHVLMDDKKSPREAKKQPVQKKPKMVKPAKRAASSESVSSQKSDTSAPPKHKKKPRSAEHVEKRASSIVKRKDFLVLENTPPTPNKATPKTRKPSPGADSTPPSSEVVQQPEGKLANRASTPKKHKADPRKEKREPELLADSTPPSSKRSSPLDDDTQHSPVKFLEATDPTQNSKRRNLLTLNMDELVRIGGIMERHGIEDERRQAFDWFAGHKSDVEKDPQIVAHYLLTAVGDLPMSRELVDQTLKFLVTRDVITKEEYKKNFRGIAVDPQNSMTIVQLAHLLSVYVDAYKKNCRGKGGQASDDETGTFSGTSKMTGTNVDSGDSP